MLFLVTDQNGSVIYLLNNKNYTVGRKDCDILINSDQSISRKHAILKVKDNKVILYDCNSRYNTFIDNAKIEEETEVVLKNGNVIRFGRLQSIYTFTEHDVITTTSSLKRQQKEVLIENMNFIGGGIVPNWTEKCTHVTVEEIMLTIKVLCALIKGIPIVKLKYWEDYVDCVKKNQPIPDCKNYVPACSELMLNCQNISLKYMEERKKLFRNKVFVFPTEQEKARMDYMIQLAGGEAISFETHPITPSVIKSSSKEYLIIISDPSSQGLQTVVDYLKEQGKRTIPLQELALAIMSCSCEKDCNPNFDRKAVVLQAKPQTQQTANILAEGTESQFFYSTGPHSIKTETVIPTSMDIDRHIILPDTQNSINQDSLKNSANTDEVVTNVKREGELLEGLQPKKIKIEEVPTSSFTKTRQRKDDVNNITQAKTELVKEVTQPGKGLFSFKNDNISNKNTSSESKSLFSNPFSKKRKAVQNEDENIPKKPAPFTDLLSKPSTSNSTASPFANILKSKITRIGSVSPPKTKKEQKVVSSTLVNSQVHGLKIDLTVIERVDKSLENSYGWISKSNCNSTVNRQTSGVNGYADDIDEQLIKYTESFKDTVVIEEEPLVVKTTRVRDNNNDASVTNNNLKNFKNFKKVTPVRIQTTIIPEARYKSVVCNDESSNPTEGPSSGDESDMDSQFNTAKRKGKRFAF